MKSNFPALNAFTRLELLFVIIILAVFAYMLFPAINAALRFGEGHSQAFANLQGISSACDCYIQDYGKFPDIPTARRSTCGDDYLSFGDTAAGNCAVHNDALFNILRAIPEGV